MNLLTVYDRMRHLGMVATKREFSRDWLGKSWSYLRDFVEDDRLYATVPYSVVTRLRERLAAVARLTPAGVARDIKAMVEAIDRAVMVQDFMRRS
jgi:hypothetical protein